jgi:hypothetical protein
VTSCPPVGGHDVRPTGPPTGGGAGPHTRGNLVVQHSSPAVSSAGSRSSRRPARVARDRTRVATVVGAGTGVRATRAAAGRRGRAGNEDQVDRRRGHNNGGRDGDRHSCQRHVRGLRRRPRGHSRQPRPVEHGPRCPPLPVPVPRGPTDQRCRRGGPRRAAPAGAPRARRIPAGDHPRERARCRGRGGLRVQRGLHPGLRPGVRRRAAGVPGTTGTDPAGRAERRPFPPARRAAPPRNHRGDLDGPAPAHGRAPRLADRPDPGFERQQAGHVGVIGADPGFGR